MRGRTFCHFRLGTIHSRRSKFVYFLYAHIVEGAYDSKVFNRLWCQFGKLSRHRRDGLVHNCTFRDGVMHSLPGGRLMAGWQGGRETTVRRRQATIIPWHHAIVAPWVTGGAMAGKYLLLLNSCCQNDHQISFSQDDRLS